LFHQGQQGIAIAILTVALSVDVHVQTIYLAEEMGRPQFVVPLPKLVSLPPLLVQQGFAVTVQPLVLVAELPVVPQVTTGVVRL
jgi:hypothetical protein